MKTNVLNYRILVEKEEQKKQDIYVAYAPSLGISDFGKTVDEAVANIENAMKLYIETLLDIGEEIPQADTDDYFVTMKKIAFSNPVGIVI